MKTQEDSISIRIRTSTYDILRELAALDLRPLVDELTVILKKEADRRNLSLASVPGTPGQPDRAEETGS